MTEQNTSDTVIINAEALAKILSWKWVAATKSCKCPCPNKEHKGGEGNNGSEAGSLTQRGSVMYVHCFGGCKGNQIDHVELPAGYVLKKTRPRKDAEGNIAAVLERSHVWKDQEGRPVATHQCLRSDDGSKSFPWKDRPKSFDLVYRYDELCKIDLSKPLILTEGEKDADAFTALGFNATCLPDGASSTLKGPRQREILRGRAVYVFYDWDAAGRSGTRKICDEMTKMGTRVYAVPLSIGGRSGYDATDLITDLGTAIGDVGAVNPADQIREISKATKLWPQNRTDFETATDRTNAWGALVDEFGNKKDVVPATVLALITIMSDSADMARVLRYDAYSEAVEISGVAPWTLRPDIFEPHLLNDDDIVEIANWWSTHAKSDFSGRMKISDAAQHVAKNTPFDRSLEFIKELESINESVDFLDGWMKRYLSIAATEDPVYVDAVTKWWMAASLNRLLSPGCKADNVLILIGNQGTGKSTFFKTLCSVWQGAYSDIMPDPGNPFSWARMRRHWHFENAEWSWKKNTVEEVIKRFITSSTDDYQPKFQNHSVMQKRRCIFSGTANVKAGSHLLKDTTGARRFWPVELQEVDINKEPDRLKMLSNLEADRMRLWSAALNYLRSLPTIGSQPLYFPVARQEILRVEDRQIAETWRDGDVEKMLHFYVRYDWKRDPNYGNFECTHADRNGGPLESVNTTEFLETVFGAGSDEAKRNSIARRNVTREISAIMGIWKWKTSSHVPRMDFLFGKMGGGIVAALNSSEKRTLRYRSRSNGFLASSDKTVDRLWEKFNPAVKEVANP